MKTILVTSTILFCSISVLIAQTKEIEGHVYDASNGEPLSFANVFLLSQQKGVITDERGHYKIKSLAKNDTLVISFLGYELHKIALRNLKGKTLNVYLKSVSKSLREIEITAKRSPITEAFQDMAVSKYKIEAKSIMLLPTLTGEPDFIKTLLLLPGATKGVEGTSDIFVRGGDADQNLVLFNGATVYNTGHLFGFLSVFNPYATSSATMLTGGFPAQYGGRLSSIIDIQSRIPSYDKFKVEGSIGTIASNLAFELPVIKDRVSLMVAGRRTYADQVLRLFDQDLPYYFYDLNAQLDINLTRDMQLRYHFYKGDDVLDFRRTTGGGSSTSGTNFVIENNTHTLSLTHRLNRRIEFHSNLFYTQFRYNIFSFFQDNRLNVVSDIYDLGLQHKMVLKPNDRHQFTTGVEIIRHQVDPNFIDSAGEIAELIPGSRGRKRDMVETSIHASWLYRIKNLSTEIGLRTSSAHVDNTTYINPEPRLNIKWDISKKQTVKASYSRMLQYMHRVSSSSFALPTDIWYPVTSDIRPQVADQVSLGIQRIFPKVDALLSLEGYYKEMQNQIAFKEATNLTLNNDFEEALLQGSGNSYGVELLFKKESGKVKGWLSYTLSWSNRQFKELNLGQEFRARYDRRHNIAVVTNYHPHPRWTFSAIWEFLSGSRFTPLIGYSAVPNAALTGIDLIPIYPDRNSVGLNDSHRLDLSITLHSKQKKDRKWRGEWQFSVYNVYNRATPIAINLVFDEETESYFYEQPGLFGTLPSLTYRFTFQK